MLDLPRDDVVQWLVVVDLQNFSFKLFRVFNNSDFEHLFFNQRKLFDISVDEGFLLIGKVAIQFGVWGQIVALDEDVSGLV